MEINQQAHAEYQIAEKEINAVYQKILKKYNSDTEFIKNLRASQRLWIQFRDAELKAMYPDREPGFYGSFHPVCVSSYLTQLTKERAKTLKLWLKGRGGEGDACAGSVKVKQ
jgi:uncharacterized protein YecT (DUF1311 family)